VYGFTNICNISMYGSFATRPLRMATWVADTYERYKVNWSRYRSGVTQRVDRGIALLLHDRGIRRGWVVSSTPRPHFTPGKEQVPILQEAGWAPGPVWKGGKFRPHRDSIPDLPARSQSLYRLRHVRDIPWLYFRTLMCVCVCVCVCVYKHIYSRRPV